MSETRKLPVLTIAGVLLPLLGWWAGTVAGRGNVGSGGWGLGEIFLFVVLILLGSLLGAICIVVALLRSERWRPLQVLILLANLYVVTFLGRPFLRGRPAPEMPMGDMAFLPLAPAPVRVGQKEIFLAYPAPASPNAQGPYLVGVRDSLGVVSDLRFSDMRYGLKPREVRLPLEPLRGRWTVRRDWDFIKDLPDKRWRQGAYLEVRMNLMGVGVPVGIADKELHTLDP